MVAKRNNNLLILLVSRIVSELGNAMFTFALGLFVLDMTSSSFSYSLILGGSILARSIANTAAGLMADRWNKRMLIFGAELMNAAVLAVLALLLVKDQLTWAPTFAGSLMLNVFGSILRVSINSAIPELLSQQEANKANGLFHSIGAIALIAGPVLAALLYEWVGLLSILVWSAVSYVLSGAMLSYLKLAGQQGKTHRESTTGLKAAVNYIRSYSLLFFFLKISALLNFILYPVMLLVLPYIAYQVIGISGTGLGIIQMCWALGMTCGSLLLIKLKRPEFFIHKFYDWLLIQAVAITAWIFPAIPGMQTIGQDGVIAIYGVLVFGIGVLQMFVQIPLYSHFQFRIASEYRGKVWGISNTLTDIAAPIGLWLYGILLEGFAWTWMPAASGLVLAVIAVSFRGQRYSDRLEHELGSVRNVRHRAIGVEQGMIDHE